MAPPGSTVALERLPETLEPAAAERDHVEPRLQFHQRRICGEPGLCSPEQAALLLGGDHLERVAVALARLGLYLAEDELTAAAQNQVELVASDPDVRAQDAVAAQAVVPQRPPFGRPAGGSGARRSRAR